MKNIDQKTVDGFGYEWDKYDQSSINDDNLSSAWDQYFDIFPFDSLQKDSIGFDMGCGSGRWAKFVAPKVGHLNCIDPSQKALQVAQENLKEFSNIDFYNGSVSDNLLDVASQDFGYSLGVLHHIPNTLEGIQDCSKLLKPGAPFLLYLYYDLEDRPFWYKVIWTISNILRRGISNLPHWSKSIITSIIAIFVYFPLARIAFLVEKLGFNVSNFLLADYRDKEFYFMLTDSLDRFGTKLEKRFNKNQIEEMLHASGFENISFSNQSPYWVCLSYKKN